MGILAVWRKDEKDFRIRRSGRNFRVVGWGYKGLLEIGCDVVGNLLEKYWFLDSFGANLVLRGVKRMVNCVDLERYVVGRMIVVGMSILGRFSFI